MPDDKKPPPRRAKSHWDDDERASQPRIAPIVHGETKGDGLSVTDGVPFSEVHHEQTPPPIIVDDVGRPVTRTRSLSPAPPIQGSRDRLTVQEVVESLWPARKALPMLMEQLQRIVVLEEQVRHLDSHGPAQVAGERIATLRAELVGHDGDGGMIGALTDAVARDIKDTRDAMTAVDERATRDAKFVRRVMMTAAGLVGGAIVSAVMMIYHAGASSQESAQALTDVRVDVAHQIENLRSILVERGQTLTEIRSQVRLLLEAQFAHPNRNTTP